MDIPAQRIVADMKQDMSGLKNMVLRKMVLTTIQVIPILSWKACSHMLTKMNKDDCDIINL